VKISALSAFQTLICLKMSNFLRVLAVRGKFRPTLSQLTRFSSTKADVDQPKNELDFRTFNLTPRTVKKLPALPPLIKEIFIGEINEAFFPFLEVVEKEHLDKFFQDKQFNQNYFLEQTKNNCIENLKQLGSFANDVPQEFRGRGFAASEIALNSEIEAENIQASHILNPHRLVTQVITELGSDQQKEKYLRRLAEGELIATVAIFENEVSEDEPFTTKAMPTNAGYSLSGEKSFVLNGEKANLFLVLAGSTLALHSHDSRAGVSAFLVDGNEPGIVRGEKLKTLGCNEVDQCSVTFVDTPVKTENLVGELNTAQKIAMHILRIGRIQSAVTANQLNKRILNHFTQYCIETKTLGGRPMDWEMLQVRMGRIVSEIYAAESMIYFTTSLLDAYENQDIDLEAAATKLFTMETLLTNSTLPFSNCGPKSTIDLNAQNVRDALQIYSQGEALDTLKLFIGLYGIEYSGNEMADLVTKTRNPTQHPEGFFKKMFIGRPFERIKIEKNFIRFLHPSLEPAAKMLEICLKRFRIGVELSLTRHGRNVIEAQTEIARLARCATLLYSCMATISRASRSYCIGLRYADMEILLANTYTLETMKEITKITNDLEEGENSTNDLNHKNISRQLFESKGYFYENPLVRVF